MTHPPANPKPLDLIAGAMHEHARWGAGWWPAWEDLNPTDTWEAELIQLAYERAREFIALTRWNEE
ncbi:hypothetical protein [Methylobacterium nonmethylotrophicum]|uniref:Uncharacterized protein n=1 Tax=Methylobacterium nonmethylotrophicum TaxID=1141884 RepID=A0A4Z0NED4_9HYPH|nr:hypothetical protein [Methylobacterium nonmethylotrophicum]TGD92501.1 hypothetical protein EU555_34730 [Methylobacterium nonmethylotrophicum]